MRRMRPTPLLYDAPGWGLGEIWLDEDGRVFYSELPRPARVRPGTLRTHELTARLAAFFAGEADDFADVSLAVGDGFYGACDPDIRILAELFDPQLAAALCGPLGACMVDQDVPHRLRRDAEEMDAVLPVLVGVASQFQVRLVDHRGGLQRVTGGLLRHVTLGELVQFAVDQRNQLLQCALVPGAPAVEQLRYFVGGGGHRNRCGEYIIPARKPFPDPRKTNFAGS